MNYLITAAGLGTRFLQNGIKPKKPLIRVYGLELLLWSLTSFQFCKGDNLYIVTLKRDGIKNRLSKKISLIYPNIKVFWLEIENHLNGQLLTALKAVEYFKINGILLIHNCDTSYKADYDYLDLIRNNNYFGMIPYFESEGNNWSFLKIKNNFVIDVKEKKRISNNCSVGTYIFKDAEQFYRLSKEYIKSSKNDNKIEKYIAPLFDYAISKSHLVIPIKCKNVKIYGTCEELLNTFSISFNELLSENDFNGNQRKTLVVDIDGTLCSSSPGMDYSKSKPIEKVCDKLRLEHANGTYIILFTSRNMKSFKGNIGLINKYTAPVLNQWLISNNIPYDELYFGKPWGLELSYIDDKSLSIVDFLK